MTMFLSWDYVFINLFIWNVKYLPYCIDLITCTLPQNYCTCVISRVHEPLGILTAETCGLSSSPHVAAPGLGPGSRHKRAAVVEARAKKGTLIHQVEKVDEKLQRKSQEHERWLLLWEELPCAEDGSRFSAAFYGNILKKRGLEAVEAEANSLLEELSLWLKTMMDWAWTSIVTNFLLLFFWCLHV